MKSYRVPEYGLVDLGYYSIDWSEDLTQYNFNKEIISNTEPPSLTISQKGKIIGDK